MTRVLVTPRSLTGPDGAALLAPLAAAGHEIVRATPGRQPTADELRALLPGCVGWIAGVEPIGADVLDAAPQLRVISRNGAGVDNIDLDAAQARGITVVRAAGANARGVAELALALCLALLRGLVPSAIALRDGRWERELGDETHARTLGVVGAGAIGRELLAMADALGMPTLATDPFPPADLVDAGHTAFVTLDELLASADVISLHCPPPPDGRPVIDAAALARMRPGAVLVNTARAGLVDDDAIVAALDDGRLRGYATDVFHEEPPRPSALLRHPRVLSTPHLGGYTRDSVRRAASAAVDNLLRALGTAADGGAGTMTPGGSRS